MKRNALIFVIGFIVAFAGGFLFFGDDTASQPVEEAPQTTDEDASESDEEAAEEEETEEQEGEQTASVDIQPLANCLSCHAVDSLGVPGGNTGPDLSIAYTEVEGKHGKDLDSFLEEPTSAVMATVIEDNPLTDEEREAIIEVLKEAAEQN
jgi:mono/diheme cytochrome c family protein